MLASLWREVERAAALVDAPGEYDPRLYLEVYQRVLCHRQTQPLPIEHVLPVGTSPHELDAIATELVPDAADVAGITAELSAYPSAQLEQDVADWYRV